MSDIYITVCYSASLAVETLGNDQQFLKRLAQYVNPVVKNVEMTAFKQHLFYRSEFIVCLAFFDMTVDRHEKMLMLVNMQDNEGSEVPPHSVGGTALVNMQDNGGTEESPHRLGGTALLNMQDNEGSEEPQHRLGGRREHARQRTIRRGTTLTGWHW